MEIVRNSLRGEGFVFHAPEDICADVRQFSAWPASGAEKRAVNSSDVFLDEYRSLEFLRVTLYSVRYYVGSCGILYSVIINLRRFYIQMSLQEMMF